MSKPMQPIERFFRRYGVVTFVVVAGLTIAGVIYICFNTYVTATTPAEDMVEGSVPASFDTTTADQIDGLYDSSKPPVNINPPQQGRINPFIE